MSEILPILPFRDAYCPNCGNLTHAYDTIVTRELSIYCDRCHLKFKGTYWRASVNPETLMIETEEEKE